MQSLRIKRPSIERLEGRYTIQELVGSQPCPADRYYCIALYVKNVQQSYRLHVLTIEVS